MSQEEKAKILSRRSFLKGVGTSVAGVGLLSAGGLLLAGCATGSPSAGETPAASGLDVPEWPFPYVKLDPDKVQERAYEAYAGGG